MNIIDNIIQIMKTKHLNQRDLCDKLGISNSTFSTWKIRGTDPPAKYILLICEFLDVSADYLLGREEKNITNINTANNSQIDNSTVIGVNNGKQYDATTNQVAEAFSKLSFLDKAKVMNLIAELTDNK